MKNFFITAILITASILFCNDKKVYSDNTITIATFNIQVFGVTKRQKKAEKVSDHYPVWAEFFTGKDDD